MLQSIHEKKALLREGRRRESRRRKLSLAWRFLVEAQGVWEVAMGEPRFYYYNINTPRRHTSCKCLRLRGTRELCVSHCKSRTLARDFR
jgi:hypothetical protein